MVVYISIKVSQGFMDIYIYTFGLVHWCQSFSGMWVAIDFWFELIDGPVHI